MKKIILFGGGAPQIAYTLYDAFTTDRAAGAVNGTTSESPYATGGGVTRTVVDGNNKLSIASGQLTYVTGGVDIGNPRHYYPIQTRAAGLMFIAEVTTAATTRLRIGWSTNANSSGALTDAFSIFDTQIAGVSGGTASGVLLTYANGVTYSLCAILRTAGNFFFIKGGTFANWTLLWMSTSGTGNEYPATSAMNATTSTMPIDNIRIPVATYIPTPLAYDTFTRSNGALGSTETTGPDSQTVAAKTWLFTSGVWAVSSNAAVGTPNVGANVIVNGGFDADTDWAKGSGWTIGSGVATKAVTSAANITQVALTTGLWYRVTYTLTRTSGSFFGYFGATSPTSVARSSSGTYTETKFAGGTSGGIRTDDGAAGDIDDISFVPLDTADLFSSVTASTPNVIADVNVTRTMGYQAGLVLNLDSETNPQNYVVACVSFENVDNRIWLLKCVAGTITSVIAANGYSAGATLRVIKSGTSYSLYYNGAQVGTTQTISDAGIVSNTLHGLFSTSALNSLDGFTLWARGVSDEYATLDNY